MKLTNPISLCIVFDDRVTDTCVACDQGGSCGNSFFISGGHCHGQNFMVFLQIVAKSLIKKLPERHGSNNVEHRQALAAFPFFYNLESEITLSEKQRFHRTFFNARIGFYLRYADALFCNPRVIEWP